MSAQDPYALPNPGTVHSPVSHFPASDTQNFLKELNFWKLGHGKVSFEMNYEMNLYTLESWFAKGSKLYNIQVISYFHYAEAMNQGSMMKAIIF